MTRVALAALIAALLAAAAWWALQPAPERAHAARAPLAAPTAHAANVVLRDADRVVREALAPPAPPAPAPAAAPEEVVEFDASLVTRATPWRVRLLAHDGRPARGGWALRAPLGEPIDLASPCRTVPTSSFITLAERADSDGMISIAPDALGPLRVVVGAEGHRSRIEVLEAPLTTVRLERGRTVRIRVDLADLPAWATLESVALAAGGRYLAEPAAIDGNGDGTFVLEADAYALLEGRFRIASTSDGETIVATHLWPRGVPGPPRVATGDLAEGAVLAVELGSAAVAALEQGRDPISRSSVLPTLPR